MINYPHAGVEPSFIARAIVVSGTHGVFDMVCVSINLNEGFSQGFTNVKIKKLNFSIKRHNLKSNPLTKSTDLKYMQIRTSTWPR